MKIRSNELMALQRRCEIMEAGHLHSVQRLVRELGRGLGLDDTLLRKLDSLAAQCAALLLVDLGRGELLVRPLSDVAASQGRRYGIKLLAIRSGAYAADVPDLTQRLSGDADELDLWCQPGQGIALRAVIWSLPGRTDEAPIPSMTYGVISLPIRGEVVSGDAWSFHVGDLDVTVLVADGLGHGPLANRAATEAATVLLENADEPPDRIVHLAHGALRETVGAAIGVARVPVSTGASSGRATFAGVGNVSASVWTEQSHKHLASHDGVVGHSMRRVQEFEVHCPENSLFVMHSDGLSARWDLSRYAGLAVRHPALIAAVLYRDFARSRDDVTVFVYRVGRRLTDSVCAVDATIS